MTPASGGWIAARTGVLGADCGSSLHTREPDGGNGASLAGVAITGPYQRATIGGTFRNGGDHGPACEGGSHYATGLTARLVPVCLRAAIGIPELASSLEKVHHLPAFVALWHEFHLPAAEIFAPAYAVAGLCGALLLLAGWKTRPVAVLFVAGLLSEILLTKRPLVMLAGWMLEWQSLCVVLILARIGAGPWSLDGRSARRARTRFSGESLTSGGVRHAQAE